MKKVIAFLCEVCEKIEQDETFMERHESLCLAQKNREAQRLAQRVAFGQLTIGQIIKKCEQFPVNLPVMVVSSDTRYSDKYPLNPDSYRGYYDELSFDVTDKPCTCFEFLTRLKLSLENTFYGYKGGEYSMCESTFVWIAESGVNSSLAVVDVRLSDDQQKVVLETKSTKD